MTHTRTLRLLPLLLCCIAVAGASCSKGSGERAGKQLDEAAEKAGEAADKAWDKTKEAADAAAEKAKEAAEKVKDAATPDEHPAEPPKK